MVERSKKRALVMFDEIPEPDVESVEGNSVSTQTDLSMKGMDEDIAKRFANSARSDKMGKQDIASNRQENKAASGGIMRLLLRTIMCCIILDVRITSEAICHN